MIIKEGEKMEKILLVAILLISTLYSSNNIAILSKEQNSRTVDMLIRGNGEQCTLSIDNTGVVIETNCLQLTNSKKIEILCTPKKKICKTQQELQEATKQTKRVASKDYSKNLKEYSNSIFRFSVKYPAELLTEKHLDGEGYGAWLQTDEEGTVQVKVNGVNAMEIQDAKQAYREAINWINEDSNNRNEITYKVQKENWFLLSGYNHRNKTIFYEKRYFLKGNETKDADIIVGFRISYPVRDKKKYDKLVSTINENFKYYNDYTIKGDGEQCTVSIDNTGVLVETNCLQLRNSKKIDILCTKNKKICKTVSEVRDALSGASSAKGPDFPLPSKFSNITPSFDCTRASTGTEYDICRSDKVAALDSELGNIYLKIKNDMPLGDFRSLIEIQKEWIDDRDHKCSTQSNFAEREKCLIEFYQKRMEAFNLISVMDSQMNYSYSYSDIYEHGTSQERFELSAYLYYQENDIKKATKLLRKIIADKQEDFIDAFFALQDIHEDYIKEFPQISEKLLGENHGSIGASLMDLNATQDKVIDVLIKEAYLLDAYAEIMLMVKYQYPVKDQPFHDKRILSFYSECAKEGIPRCEEFLGRIYLNGWGVKQNTDKGIKLLKQSELGDAYMALAEYYYEKNDIENSKKYYKKASERGEYKATYNLGVFAQDDKKYKKAIDYFNAVLEENDKYYPAMLELSRMFIEGWGTETNYKKAIDLLQNIIDNSDDIEIQELATGNLSIAEYQLGLKYLTSKASNKTKAFILIEKSAKNNNMYAQYELAKMYFNGAGVKKDEIQVIKWYKKAAEQGHPEAQLFLSLRYLEGRGVQKDHTQALSWAKKSAESGDSDGQYLYGKLIFNENRDNAIEWYKKAAEQGHKKAKEELDIILLPTIPSQETHLTGNKTILPPTINTAEYITPKNDLVECIAQKQILQNGNIEKLSDRRSVTLGKARLAEHKRISLTFLDEKYTYFNTKTSNKGTKMDTYRNDNYPDYYLMLPAVPKDMTGIFNVIVLGKKGKGIIYDCVNMSIHKQEPSLPKGCDTAWRNISPMLNIPYQFMLKQRKDAVQYVIDECENFPDHIRDMKSLKKTDFYLEKELTETSNFMDAI